MLNTVIRAALRYRLLTLALAIVVLAYGGYTLWHLPIDVFPDLDRPRVTLLTEAHGYAPEEVETLITLPLESVLNGATGVRAVRSTSSTGLSIIYVEFDWGTNPYVARQIVNEKLSLAAGSLPAGIRPMLAPISSIMGQIMIIGMWSEGDKTSPMEVRTLADWVVRQRLLTVPGVAQIVDMGGGRKQYQVLIDPQALIKYDVTLDEIEKALDASNSNATGGYVNRGGDELLVRSLGRVQSLEELSKVVVRPGNPSVQLHQVARIVEGPQVKRGDSAVNGHPAVVLVVTKQPGTDTRLLTDRLIAALEDLQTTLPPDIRILPDVFQQKIFIDRSIHNVLEALRDGSLLVVIVLFLFLLNLRTTFITLTAIPLSIVVTGLVFHVFGMSINTMTLGGLAVAIGELVDDAIVDVENIFRRLRENAQRSQPLSNLRVVYEASSEVRNSIVFSTVLVVLVFVPLFALGGMEGRLFRPLATAYIVSILASLVVSLTVTPVLAYWLLPGARRMGHSRDSFLLRWLKVPTGWAIRLSTRFPWPILSLVVLLVTISVSMVTRLGRDFLPPFNEGSVQVNVILPPGTSLEMSNRIASVVDQRLKNIPGVRSVGRRTGRAEQDEHAMGVNETEIILTFDPDVERSREEILADIRAELDNFPEAMTSAEQPLQHLMSHMLSGVQSQVGIKIYGDDLEVLRATAKRVSKAIEEVPGVVDPMVEPLVDVPQLQIRLNYDRLATYGLHANDVNDFIETAINGRVISDIVLGQRKFDLLLRLDDPYREDPATVGRLALELHDGTQQSLSTLADIAGADRASGPNTINRENARRRIVVQCNAAGRDLGSVVDDIRAKLVPIQASLPSGYYMEMVGQFESQQSAATMISLLSLGSLACMFLALYTLFRSANLALQVLAALPMAAIGAVAALVVTRQSLTVASMVGFISLAGIASRNGILLIAHYLHLVRYEREGFTPEMLERAGKERLAPMLMTALTAGIALVPLVLAANDPGKEILYPVATVILGGLISSTLLDFFVHPALFWCFGRRQAERLLAEAQREELLSTDAPAQSPPMT